MTYPCGIIRDLLPLYIDDVCNEESRQAIENHLSECEKCRDYYEAMKSTDGFVVKGNDNSEDMRMTNSLKNVKSKINKKIRNIVLGAIAAVLLFIIGFNLLLVAAIKNVPLDDVSISAEVYSLAELAQNSANEMDAPTSENVIIYSNEADNSETIEIKIPDFGTATISEDTIEKCKYATVIFVSSPKYFLRTVKSEIKGDTMYISAFKTSMLKNKPLDNLKTMSSIEFREINRIVYAEGNGKETVLWSRK